MRALTTWRPGRELSTLHREIDDLFDRLFAESGRLWRLPMDGTFEPAVESFLRNGDLVVRADLPGIDPKEVELSVEGDRLLIRGERKRVDEGDRSGGTYREIAYGCFERSLLLPPGVDAESIKAEYRNGVLEITMKAPKNLVAKKVPIEVHS